ncbi:hypothetical protein [Halobacillus halophilus]|uniref:hypothetical protein n=1 Tax=Halobacillus halophilus TaxID=1570 RepID=UPI001CD29F52|nr:hypothetical protein [Halobacillus halophilus]MCA1011605.1 hypothetical protein [Halobacillus halophilus]
MPKSKMFFIMATIAITLLGCSQVEEGIYIQGNIIEVNKQNGNMEIDIESWTTVEDSESSTELNELKNHSNSQTIRVSNPHKYEEGQKVEVKVIKEYDEDVWDLDRLNFETKKLD